MSATLTNGTLLSKTVRAEVARRAAQLAAQGCRPGLAVILVGDDPASSIYVRNKINACQESGVHSICDRYPATFTEARLLARIDALNQDPTIHGILVQLPLPSHFNRRTVINAISPDKDVDGLHTMNAGALMSGAPRFLPCTPAGVMRMLAAMHIPLEGSQAVVIGCSESVGKPMALLLLEAGATVAVCQRQTGDLALYTRSAELLVVAAGHPKLLTAEMVKPDAVVIDVGIHRTADGKLCGDVDFDAVRKVAGFITPVPGGVGPMTIGMLLMNTLQAAEYAFKTRPYISACAMTSSNPLLDFSDLPRFDEIRAEHITPALDALLADAAAAIERACAPDTPALRAAHAENLPRITRFWSSVGQNRALYQKYKAIAESRALDTFSQARRHVILNALRDFRLAGAELDDSEKPRFAALQERQAALSKEFADHALDATDAYSIRITQEDELAGLPDNARAAARNAAEKAGAAGWRFTLHLPSYLPVLQYAEHRPLREAMYRAYVSRASELGAEYAHGKAEWDNTANMAEQLMLRAQEAQMLGYRNFAEVSLASKMAESPQQVFAFLQDLAQRARPYAEREWQQLRTFAAQELNSPELAPWDIAFAAEKLRQSRYAFSEHEVRQYFPVDMVLTGMLNIDQTLFSITLRADDAPVWNPDVRFFRMENQNGQLIAQFYLDLYAREGKRSGAWMDDARGRWCTSDGELQTPVAYLVCNFPAPVNGKPACLSHNEVLTLFHEFGHGLHHMLTRIDEIAVSGINGVEWDAVELPSQFMENFCWEEEVLCSMSRHVDTEEPLPRALLKKMRAAKNFHSGLNMLRQIVFSIFDLHLHSDFDT